MHFTEHVITLESAVVKNKQKYFSRKKFSKLYFPFVTIYQININFAIFKIFFRIVLSERKTDMRLYCLK